MEAADKALDLVQRLIACHAPQAIMQSLLSELHNRHQLRGTFLLRLSDESNSAYGMTCNAEGNAEEFTFDLSSCLHWDSFSKGCTMHVNADEVPFSIPIDTSLSIHALPLTWQQSQSPTLLVFRSDAQELSDTQIDWINTAAQALNIALRNAETLQNLRDSSQQESFARFEAERSATEQRESSKELLRTKNFLESMIAASVDGIVAADLRGNVILYNHGAERIHQRRGEDVVGYVHVTELYPKGTAERIMRMIRSDNHGGPGRLNSTRLEAVESGGNHIPISLSAAMVYDDAGREKASFGIFTDLREWVQVEQRLADAREKLKLSDSQAMIAELAGAAAHELNQPLTTIVAYSDMLIKRIKGDALEERAIAAIVRDAQRMADIVKKIGRITKYETTSYVGSQKIFDIDRAAEEQGPEGT